MSLNFLAKLTKGKISQLLGAGGGWGSEIRRGFTLCTPLRLIFKIFIPATLIAQNS